MKYTIRGILFLQLMTPVIAARLPRQETIGSLIMQNPGNFASWPSDRNADLPKARSAYNTLVSLILIKGHC